MLAALTWWSCCWLPVLTCTRARTRLCGQLQAVAGWTWWSCCCCRGHGRTVRQREVGAWLTQRLAEWEWVVRGVVKPGIRPPQQLHSTHHTSFPAFHSPHVLSCIPLTTRPFLHSLTTRPFLHSTHHTSFTAFHSPTHALTTDTATRPHMHSPLTQSLTHACTPDTATHPRVHSPLTQPLPMPMLPMQTLLRLPPPPLSPLVAPPSPRRSPRQMRGPRTAAPARSPCPAGRLWRL